MNRNYFTISEHILHGSELKDARECLQILLISLPPGSRVSKQARRALKAVGDLRCTLDSMVCEDVPERRDPRRLATKVYYGTTRLQHNLTDQGASETDAFAGYRETT